MPAPAPLCEKNFHAFKIRRLNIPALFIYVKCSCKMVPYAIIIRIVPHEVYCIAVFLNHLALVSEIHIKAVQGAALQGSFISGTCCFPLFFIRQHRHRSFSSRSQHALLISTCSLFYCHSRRQTRHELPEISRPAKVSNKMIQAYICTIANSASLFALLSCSMYFWNSAKSSLFAHCGFAAGNFLCQLSRDIGSCRGHFSQKKSPRVRSTTTLPLSAKLTQEKTSPSGRLLQCPGRIKPSQICHFLHGEK